MCGSVFVFWFLALDHQGCFSQHHSIRDWEPLSCCDFCFFDECDLDGQITPFRLEIDA